MIGIEVALFLNSFHKFVKGYSFVDEIIFLRIGTIFGSLYYLFFVSVTAREIASALKIHIFTIPTKKE